MTWVKIALIATALLHGGHLYVVWALSIPALIICSIVVRIVCHLQGKYMAEPKKIAVIDNIT